MARVHFGATDRACGTSALIVEANSLDIGKVSCMHCLWMLQATALQNADTIANRIKDVVEADYMPALSRKGGARG